MRTSSIIDDKPSLQPEIRQPRVTWGLFVGGVHVPAVVLGNIPSLYVLILLFVTAISMWCQFPSLISAPLPPPSSIVEDPLTAARINCPFWTPTSHPFAPLLYFPIKALYTAPGFAVLFIQKATVKSETKSNFVSLATRVST